MAQPIEFKEPGEKIVYAELKETTSFTIEPSMIAKLDAIAAEDKTSRSALIRWILTTFVDNYK